MKVTDRQDIDAYGMTWTFSPDAVYTLEPMGVSAHTAFKSLILKLLSMQVVREGETELNFYGAGLRIVRQGDRYLVDALSVDEYMDR